jgi:hypothetical protein
MFRPASGAGGAPLNQNPLIATELDHLESQLGNDLKVVDDFSRAGKLKASFSSLGLKAYIAIGAAVAMVTAAVIVGAILGVAASRASGVVPVPTTSGPAKFRLLHLNDMHARVEGMTTTESGATLADRNNDKADGGWPKIFTAAKQMVDSSEHPTIFLEDGDQFMGTIWHT